MRVVAIKPNGKVLAMFPSVARAAMFFSLGVQDVLAVITGRRKSVRARGKLAWFGELTFREVDNEHAHKRTGRA